MTRRILASMLVVVAVAQAIFAVPLAIAVRRRQLDQDARELFQVAALTAARVKQGRVVVPRSAAREPDQRIGVYDLGGALVDGSGPTRLDVSLAGALGDEIRQAHEGGHLIVAVPWVDGAAIGGVVRASEPLSAGRGRLATAWLELLALTICSLGGAAVVARSLTGRLTGPLLILRGDADRIGDGDFTVTPSATGIEEIDAVGLDLARAAARIGDLLSREQAFSTEASHQLRSPLTGLRLTLESELAHPHLATPDLIRFLLADIDRLEATVSSLVGLGRDTHARTTMDLKAAIGSVAEPARRRLAAQSRHLHLPEQVPAVTASRAAVEHILDVLVDNAIVHGAGDVKITVITRRGLVHIAIADKGPGMHDAARAFDHEADGRAGIGLRLARRLAEAEGGRLRHVPSTTGATFELVLPVSPAADQESAVPPAEPSPPA
ncbi:MAG: HAMP domain-containing sensor histidine kinase [Acidimicrobiales bacterium]